MKHLYAITLFSLVAGTSMHAADEAEQIQNAIENHNRERVRQLVNADNINIALPFFGYRPLHFSIALDSTIALDLIGLGADINDQEPNNKNTPLHIATGYNRLIVVQSLLNAGALTTEKNSNGKTPLDIAKEHQHSKIIQILESWEEDIKEPEHN